MADEFDRTLTRIKAKARKLNQEKIRAFKEMKALGVEKIKRLLAANPPEPDVRLRAAAALLSLDAKGTLEVVLPMLNDPDDMVSWEVCNSLYHYGDERAVGPLVAVLADHTDPSLRCAAAYALRGIGSPAAIPALVRALDNDHEPDDEGYTTSQCAGHALDEILGTNITRIKVTKRFNKLAPYPPDLAALKKRAQEVYESWALRHQAEPARAPDRGGG
jgi:HEAT repeat protein